MVYDGLPQRNDSANQDEQQSTKQAGITTIGGHDSVTCAKKLETPDSSAKISSLTWRIAMAKLFQITLPEGLSTLNLDSQGRGTVH